MVGLIDIAPGVETVEVQGAPVAVHGISAKGLASLLGRFPELRPWRRTGWDGREWRTWSWSLHDSHGA